MSEANEELPKRDDVFADYNRLATVISELDERGLILALAAFAEEALGDLIGAFMMPGEPAAKLLEGFNAPLGTFSARIKMAYALGLVTKRQYDDLERLRRIRNEFAHSWEPISFTDRNIASHIAALHFSSLDDEYPDTPLRKVRTSLSVLLLELRSTTGQIRKYDRRVELIGHHLIAGLVGELDDQLAKCRKRLGEIDEEIKSASGDRRRFLLAQRYSWEGKLEIARSQAPKERQQEIKKLQAELRAWNVPPAD